MKEMIKKLQKRSNKKGFTLVEIIVVLVILAILAAIAVPSVLGYVNDAKDSKYIAEARSIYLVIQVEEAKVDADNKANGTTTAYDYGAIATTAADKTELGVTKISKTGDTYTVEWDSHTATIQKDKEVKITKR